MDLSKIVIGTSAWGSKICYKDAIDIGSRCIDMGLENFDTGPHYGSGYAHHILNNLNYKTKILVDTKFGDTCEYSFKEIFKRVYRFSNFNNFKKSFQYLEARKKNNLNKEYWKINNILTKINFFQIDLDNTKLNTIYLHDPPENLITKDYLITLQNRLKTENLRLGISSPNIKDFHLVQNEFTDINIQISFNFYQKYKNEIKNNKNKILINSLFKNNNFKQNEYIDLDFINEIMQNSNNSNIKFKLIIGINSKKSFYKLKKFLNK
tara:strand:+ start:6391 stop:7185 length:795 start_codon:yes stop_codon:yes gene_type:complete